MLPFSRVTVIGMGLIGSSLTRAVRALMPTVRLTGFDADPLVRERVRALDLVDDVTDTAAAAAIDADLIVLCVPVRAMRAIGEAIASELSVGAVVSDTGSVKGQVLADLGAVRYAGKCSAGPCASGLGHREIEAPTRVSRRCSPTAGAS